MKKTVGRSAKSVSIREWGRSILIALAIWMVVRTFVVEAFRIPSGSMENTLLVGDFLFVTKALYGAELPLTHTRFPGIREPRRGELVVFKSVEGDFAVVKRLIGVPGDTVAMSHGVLFRNGQRLDEPYARNTDSGSSASPAERARMRALQLPHLASPPGSPYSPDVHDWGPLVVPGESLFVMGDNRDNSLDSRYWGFVPRANLKGKPLIVYYSYEPDTWLPLPFLTAIRWRRLFTQPR
jgi:signal peptidase I